MNIKKYLENRALLVLASWFAFSWSWVLFTDSLDLAGDPYQGLTVAIIVLIFNTALSVAIFWKSLRLIGHLFRKIPLPLAILASIPLFALVDFLISWLPAIIWIGPEGSLDNVLPLSSPALILINTPLGFASRLVGFYGLAGFFWLGSYLLWNKTYRVWSIPVIILLCLTAIIGHATWNKAEGSQFDAKIITETLNERVPVINGHNTKLVVFPEYGLDNIDNTNYQDRIQKSDNSTTATFFLGSKQINPDDRVGHYNSLLFGDSKNGIISRQDKYRLIPGGEDLPFAVRTGLRATNQKDTLDYFSYAKGVLKGPRALQPYNLGENTVIGSAVCSSIISPQDYRLFASQGATAFTNSASLTIFKGSPLFAWQQKSLARFMATANARYFLQSANSARAYALDHNGKTLKEATGIQVVDVTVQNNTKHTFYTQVGEWLVWIGAIIAGAFIIRWLPHSRTYKALAKRQRKSAKQAKKRKVR